MSTLQNSQPVWPMNDSKYEKCLNITEEIYKRINITFQIKKLETGSQSDISNESEQIDSNELSNETDLFAYEKRSSISSSCSDVAAREKQINLNNNEEARFKKVVPPVASSRPKKKFRKRVKKRHAKKKADSDCSSDEGVPLSRIVDHNIKPADDVKAADHRANVTSAITETMKSETDSPVNDLQGDGFDIANTNKEDIEDDSSVHKSASPEAVASYETTRPNSGIENMNGADENGSLGVSNVLEVQAEKGEIQKSVTCLLCHAVFRGSRGLKRHMTMSHISSSEEVIIQP